MDARNEKLSYRMREAQIKKVPYTLILGDNEMNENKISYRVYGKNETVTVSWDEFLSLIKTEIEEKRLLGN